jgi:hypothetical protein
MGLANDGASSLTEMVQHVARTAPRVEALLARHFPAGGGYLYPDASGNVCVAAGSGLAADRPASIYARCVAKLGPLVAAFSASSMNQAAIACIRLAKERTVFACALDCVRHPLDPMQRQLFVARMMPAPEVLFRQDDATASCIWLRLWTLHAWLLELRLVIALSGDARRAEPSMLAALDRDYTQLLRPDAHWLSVDLGDAAAAEMVARAPAEALPVGTLVWPNRLGALLSDFDVSARGVGVRQEDGRTWVSFHGRFAEMPHIERGGVSRIQEAVLF